MWDSLSTDQKEQASFINLDINFLTYKDHVINIVLLSLSIAFILELHLISLSVQVQSNFPLF